MKKLLLIFLIFFVSPLVFGRSIEDKPKLVVGIVIDQMRYDYLYRYAAKYSNNGFKKLMNNGFNCKNTQYHYAATQTGPGHSHIFNGSIPALSGIIGNSWFERTIGKSVYVASDTTVTTIGEGSPEAGQMSPKSMLVSSIGDQLRLSNEFQSKVIGVSLKDRGAIFPAGHSGTAYWFDVSTGNWITSSYYMKELPQWVNDFNAQHLPDFYLKNKWETLLALNQYTESESDNQPYENAVLVKGKTSFPYDLANYSKLPSAPMGNNLTKDFALRVIKEEHLGERGSTDFLTISFASTDYVGHATGTHSVEIEDTYLRLDKDIAEIVTSLEHSLGKDNVLVMLTADHGVADIPAYSQKNKIPSGVFWGGEIVKLTNEIVKKLYNSSKWLLMFENNQLYLNSDSTSKYTGSLNRIYLALKDSLNKREGIYTVVNLTDLSNAKSLPYLYHEMFTNTYYPRRSGDFQIVFEPNWVEGYVKGTNHGSIYAYDTHVPLLWYGWKIKKGEIYRRTSIADIAPTLAQILDILEPNGSIGNPIIELWNN